jgi:hypothetical protein
MSAEAHPLMQGESTQQAGARALQSRAAAALTALTQINGLPTLTWRIHPVLSVRLHTGPDAHPVMVGMAATYQDLRAWAHHHRARIVWPSGASPSALISTEPAIRVYCPSDLATAGRRDAA